jgi:phosphatidylinositol N-acetylglucosaminyltransferase subunit H
VGKPDHFSALFLIAIRLEVIRKKFRPATTILPRMLSTAPHLHTRRPSPTTIEYTVSTKPTLTLPLRLILLATFLVRLVLGFSTILLLYCKWHLSTYSTSPPPPSPPPIAPPLFTSEFIWYAIDTIHFSALGALFTSLAAQIPTLLLLPISGLMAYSTIRRIHTAESLLVLRGLGIQTSTSSTTYLGTASTRFIPTEKIQDILVNEAFRGFEVRYYLVVVVEGEDEVVVVFPRLLPGRAIVERVWRGARGCLYEPENREGVEKEGYVGR